MQDKYFGSISLEEDNWLIRCEPHVKTRFKRVFPQVRQSASASIIISDTPNNCHDLLWFMDRYPLEVNEKDLKRLQKSSNAYTTLKKDIVQIIEHNKTNTEFDLAFPAYDYQRSAAELLLSVNGLLLADEVGLGKTVSAICPLTTPNTLPALFVTLTHLPKQIEKEVNRFVPNLKTHIIQKTTAYPLIDKDGNFPDVIICSYSKLNGWAEHLAGKIKYVVFDEIQELRTGAGSLKYDAAKCIADEAIYKLGLSATPIYNYGHEFFNIIDVLRPNVLGSRIEFLREWCHNEKKISEPQSFGTFLRDEGIMLLRTRADVKRELPPVQTIVQHIDSDAKILDKIKGYAAELAKIILQSGQDFKGQKLRATEEFNMLMRQSTGLAKAPYVAEFVKLLVESGESVVLYGWHRDVYNIWLERLKEYNPVLYTGSESPAAKERSKQDFMEGKSKVLIISLRSGAGLDGLQYHPNCSITVFGELDWSSGVHEQCVGRLDRDGQDKNVLVYYLLSETGSDPIISETLGLKKEQLDGVKYVEGELITRLEGDTSGIKKLAADYLNTL